MNRVDILDERYAAVRSLVGNGVKIIAVGDTQGAAVHAVVGQLLAAERLDGAGIWDELIGAAKALRWRLVTQPQPASFNQAVRESARRVQTEAGRMRDAVEDESLLDQAATAAAAVLQADSPVGEMLHHLIEEVGADSCVVVAASGKARATLQGWLAHRGTEVVTAGELGRTRPRGGDVFVVGPPMLYGLGIGDRAGGEQDEFPGACMVPRPIGAAVRNRAVRRRCYQY